MMRLSRTTEYALHATLQLAQSKSGRTVPCSLLAESGSMPERFLLQVLRTLTTRGILVSTRGVQGGYMLGRPVNQISLLNLLEAVEGPVVGYLPPDNVLSNDTQVKLSATLENAAASVRMELDRLTLARLISSPSAPLSLSA